MNMHRFFLVILRSWKAASWLKAPTSLFLFSYFLPFSCSPLLHIAPISLSFSLFNRHSWSLPVREGWNTLFEREVIFNGSIPFSYRSKSHFHISLSHSNIPPTSSRIDFLPNKEKKKKKNYNNQQEKQNNNAIIAHTYPFSRNFTSMTYSAQENTLLIYVRLYINHFRHLFTLRTHWNYTDSYTQKGILSGNRDSLVGEEDKRPVMIVPEWTATGRLFQTACAC